ncbi:MAG: hypothetical protein OIF47_03570 [Marinibacterium sp.]|nr:hypothetical protein [Marinibacterium sp.]
MSSLVRLFCLMALVVSLLFTAQTAVQARGQAMATDQMVICAGATTTVIYLDADGVPTSATHLCPDYALTLLSAPLPGLDLPVRPAVRTVQRLHVLSQAAQGRDLQRPRARAPPAPEPA